MSDERTDHAAEARRLLDRAAQWSESDAAEIGADIAALTNATLAILEQQRIANEQARIANLIALWHGSPVKEEYIGDGERGLLVSGGGVLRPEIREALGIRE